VSSIRRSIGLAPVAMLVASCGSSVATTARNTFIAEYRCSSDEVVVRERPDLSSPPNGPQGGALVEVSGCDANVIYACDPPHASTDAIRSRSGWRDAWCRPTGWCTEPGCDSFGEAVRHAFVKDETCPYERVNATAHEPVLPAAPPDVAADPERMRVWTQFHREQIGRRTFMTATGCGARTVYECDKPPGTRTIPVCEVTAPAEEPPPAPTPVGDPTRPLAEPR
jgi:hypothetical protein